MKKQLLSPLLLSALLVSAGGAAETTAEVKNLSLAGGLEDGKARLVLEAVLKGLPEDKDKPIVATALQHLVRVSQEKISHQFTVKCDVLQGEPKELVLALAGDGEIREVKGEALQDWGVRQDPGGVRYLVLRPKKSDKTTNQFLFVVSAEKELTTWSNPIKTLTLAPLQTAFFNGFVKIQSVPELDVQPVNPTGLVPIEVKFLPEELRGAARPDEPEPLAFRFLGAAYTLPLNIAAADPDTWRVVLRDFRLTGQLRDQMAAFTLTAIARVKDPQGSSGMLISTPTANTGGVALTEAAAGPDWRLKYVQGQFVLAFDKPGDYPIQVRFNAAVQQSNGWNLVDFRVARATLQPITLQGLASDTQFQFAGAARPERVGPDFLTYVPADGAVRLAWKEARREAEGRLFYSAEALAQITISPGLMRQAMLLDFKVTQGELNRVSLLLRGQGEVTRVGGEQVLAWKLEPVPNSTDRRLMVQLNQAQKDAFSLQVQIQRSLGAFPQAVEALQVRPEGATRFAGCFRVANEGAVRLEVVQAAGLSQISPEQFPETDATRALFRAAGGQRFVFRYSGADFGLRIQADNILPEISVSEVLAYHLGETELIIDAEIELDVREAPVRELIVRVPKGYALARLAAAGLSDYFLREPADQPEAELRLVYGQPVSGRQVIQLRLERNKALAEASWVLPRIEVSKAKSTRGHLAASSDVGFRLSPEKTQGLTEIASAFFPKKLPGIQAAFRLTDAAWQATLRVERLPQTVQADAFHLFSVGEGIAYGSSLLNYLISGAPVSAFKVELSNEYFNVEFAGKDIRNWTRTENGYLVQLHTPVSGPYTLLATYERPFNARGETLAFTGARPLDAQTEQGHTVVISAYQFQVQPALVSPGLLPLETGEVPPEYRLFFDAPILAAYRYTSRPFNLRLALSRLAQGETLSQVTDRASLRTRISKEGQVLTDATYFVKNRGQPHFRLTLPRGTDLWSVTVNEQAVVPVMDNQTNFIPLPVRADPNAVLRLDLKLATRSKNAEQVKVEAPMVATPVLLGEWRLEPDAKQRLVYRRGSLTPAAGVADASGFADLGRLFTGPQKGEALTWLALAVISSLAAMILWRWATAEGVHRFSARHLAGSGIGLVGLVLATLALFNLGDLARLCHDILPRDLTLLAPVQQSGSALSVEVGNLPDKPSFLGLAWRAWPALLALAVWIYARFTSREWSRHAGGLIAWTLLGWAVLRWPNGAAALPALIWLFLLLQVFLPAARRLWQVPAKPKPAPPAQTGLAAASALLALAGLAWLSLDSAPAIAAAGSPAKLLKEPPLAESVTQQVRVEDKFVFGTARIRWQAVKGQILPLLYEPAVMTRIGYPTNALKLVRTYTGSRNAESVLALADGPVELEAQYQLQASGKDGGSGFTLPTQFGLVNRLALTLADLDVDVACPQAVSVEREAGATNQTLASLVLSPVNEAWIGWKPRSRDVRREKVVFYAELAQLYVPSAGVIEGAHLAQVRPAQGELTELVFDVPGGATISDVNEPAKAAAPVDAKNVKAPGTSSSLVSLWRFDPETRKLRVNLNPPQSRPFNLLIRSQVATGPLPFEQRAGLIAVSQAADQLGSLGVATGPDVQLDSVTAEAFTPINLEDFPGAVLDFLQAQFPGLTLRRAFRYSDTKGLATLKASSVEPDLRVETQETLSLGEDRTVLASTLNTEITRAGLFRVSFILPEGMDVESISSPAMSHWTELKSEAGRVITLHLRGKTEGKQQFAVSLAGPGVRTARGWAVPRLVLREASKQQGQLLIVPEQGMRLTATTRDGVIQVDPEKAGIRQKGVLAFRLLQSQWRLALDIEQVDAWIQVGSLQHVTVNEAQVKVAANLQYQIENTGLKALRVLLPTNAESVRFTGEQVADFLPTPGRAEAGLQEWEIKLHRRIIGRFLLQVTYQQRLPDQAGATTLRGVQAQGVNLQRGFLTVQSGGRLQMRVPTVPAALQPSEWQTVPRNLRQDLQAASANYTFRLVEPAWQLPIQLERHEAAQLLPARVNSILLNSVISDEGVMLTQVRLAMVPGDKRLLYLTLPTNATFWFAFVNQNGVWPWLEQTRLLIPLERQPRSGQIITVEFFYSSRIGQPGRTALDLELLGPRFDLPLENIQWQVRLSEKWQLKDWKGSLQLQDQQVVAARSVLDVQTYLQHEASLQQEKTREAEQMLAMGNSALEQGDPGQARRAFQAAYGLSTHDDAFNEDARVQLHNLKLQQVLLGLNVRQATVAGEGGGLAAKLRDLRNRKDVAYTQQEAKQIIEASSAEENAAFMRLAERLIQQQDAAVSSPTAIRASVPEQGRLLIFTRAVQVDTWAELKLDLKASAVRAASAGRRIEMLAAVFLLLALLAWAARRLQFRPAK